VPEGDRQEVGELVGFEVEDGKTVFRLRNRRRSRCGENGEILNPEKERRRLEGC